MKNNITYIGLGHGSFLMFLAQSISEKGSTINQLEKVGKFIALSPCVYYES